MMVPVEDRAYCQVSRTPWPTDESGEFVPLPTTGSVTNGILVRMPGGRIGYFMALALKRHQQKPPEVKAPELRIVPKMGKDQKRPKAA